MGRAGRVRGVGRARERSMGWGEGEGVCGAQGPEKDSGDAEGKALKLPEWFWLCMHPVVFK